MKTFFYFSNTITCDKTDIYLRWFNESGTFSLFISLRNLTTMVKGLALATLSTLQKQLRCYEKFSAITISNRATRVKNQQNELSKLFDVDCFNYDKIIVILVSSLIVTLNQITYMSQQDLVVSYIPPTQLIHSIYRRI